jgi:hypothetical protein
MKIIGTLDVKDDGDLLKEVLDHCAPLVDEIYAYDDGSQDDTLEILKSHHGVSKFYSKLQFSDEELSRYLQHRRGYLLEQVKKDFPYEKEDIWVVRLEGDRFFLNQDPREIVARAVKAGHDSRSGVMLDFRRHRVEGWEGVDTWPNWHESIRKIQTWCNIDDIHATVAFKVADYIGYENCKRPRPWPRGCRSNDLNRERLSKDMAFFEHHGRRGPKYCHWAYTSGSRPLSKCKSKTDSSWDFSTPETVYKTMKARFQPYYLIPWVGLESLDFILEFANNDEWKDVGNREYFFLGLEQAVKFGWKFERKDL